MRILWLTPYVPLPTFGGGTRVFNLINFLATTCEIDLISAESASEEQLGPLRAICRTVTMATQPRRQRRLLQLLALFSRRPLEYWLHYAPSVQAMLDGALRERAYDVLVIEHAFMGYYATPPSVRVVLDQHNVESQILLKAAQRERSLLRRLYNQIDYRKFRPDEQRFCRQADLVLATSGVDRALMQRWPKLAPCIVVPNGVDCAHFRLTADDASREHSGPGTRLRVLFQGSMHYAPNAEAMIWFCATVWPRILQAMPRATLQIVGGNPPRDVLRLGQLPNVMVVGWVKDVRPYLAAAQVVVVPLRIGGGTRLKVVEALAMGRAVVSTTLGCEGLEVEHGTHVLLADDPETFARRVIELLDQPEQRAVLGRQGRCLVEERYDWPVIGGQLVQGLRELAVGDSERAVQA